MKKNILVLSAFTSVVLIVLSMFNIVLEKINPFIMDRKLFAIEFIFVIAILSLLYYFYSKRNKSFSDIIDSNCWIGKMLIISCCVSVISSIFKYVGTILLDLIINGIYLEDILWFLLYSVFDLVLVFIFVLIYGIIIKAFSKNRKLEIIEGSN